MTNPRIVAVVAACLVPLWAASCGTETDSPTERPRVTPESGGFPLHTRLVQGTPRHLVHLFEDPNNGAPAAAWDARTRRLVVISRFLYSSTCDPSPSATESDDGSVTVKLETYSGEHACTADAERVTVFVEGIRSAPLSLSFTDEGGTTSLTVSTAQ